MDSENVAVSTGESQNTGSLNDILKSNIDAADARVEEARASKPTSKPKRTEDKPAVSKPSAPAEDKGQGGAHEDETEDKPRKPAAEKPAKATTAKSEPEARPAEDNLFAPKTWTEAQRTAFESSPPEVKQAINELVKNLQGGFTKKAQQFAEANRVATDIAAAIKPHHKQELQARGMTEGQALGELLGLHDAYRANPAGYVRHLINAAKLTPEQLGFAAGQQAPQQPDATGQVSGDPEVLRLKDELAAIKGALTHAAQSGQQRKQAEQHQRETEANSVIASFWNEVDDYGQPAHPHFETVFPQVLQIAANDPEILAMKDMREKLQAAYDRATWQHPTTRQSLLDAQKKAAQAEFEAQRSRAAVGPKPRSSTGTARSNKPRTLEDSLTNAMAKFGI